MGVRNGEQSNPTLEPQPAVVKFAASTRLSQGQINIVCTLDSGKEIRIWGHPDDRNLLAAKKGQEVMVCQRGVSWQLVAQADLPTTPPSIDQILQAAPPPVVIDQPVSLGTKKAEPDPALIPPNDQAGQHPGVLEMVRVVRGLEAELGDRLPLAQICLLAAAVYRAPT